MRSTQHCKWSPGLLVALLLAGMPAVADEYAAARAELVRAYQDQDFAAMVSAARRGLAARPAHPGAGFNLALAHALHGDREEALAALNELLRRGIDFGADDLEEFAAVRELGAWRSYTDGLRRLREPQGLAEPAFKLDDGQFVPEGIAIDADGVLYLGSIRKGLLLRDGKVLSDRQGHWSVFGMRFDEDGSLWFASAAVAQLEDVGDDLGKTGLFRIDPASGELSRAAILPQYQENQLLGDLVIDGKVIYATDSLSGAVYRYDIADDEYSTLVEPGLMRSPQGLVLDAAGAHLYVADYPSGLYRVSLRDGDAQEVPVPPLTSAYGIDGLYRHGNELIAVQNGIRPHRVVAFTLSADGSTVLASRILAANLADFDEPTLGAVQENVFYFVANSHWNRFDAGNGLPEGLAGPVILKIRLDR